MNTLPTVAFAVLVSAFVSACRVPIETGPPLANPADLAAGLFESTGPDQPAFVRFDWFYGDRRGDVRGDGAARYNPTDSLRLDLFTSGEVAMAVALAGHRLTSLGEIDDVELPAGPMLFAMAGLFRPEAEAELTAYGAEADTVLVYDSGENGKLYFFARSGRLRRVEQRHRGSLRRRVEVSWAAEPGPWPIEAEYRDFGEHSRVRWTIGDTRVLEERHSSDIFDLPNSG